VDPVFLAPPCAPLGDEEKVTDRAKAKSNRLTGLSPNGVFAGRGCDKRSSSQLETISTAAV